MTLSNGVLLSAEIVFQDLAFFATDSSKFTVQTDFLCRTRVTIRRTDDLASRRYGNIFTVNYKIDEMMNIIF